MEACAKKWEALAAASPYCKWCLCGKLFYGKWCESCYEMADHGGVLFPVEGTCECCEKGRRMSNALCTDCCKTLERAPTLLAECRGCDREHPIAELADSYCSSCSDHHCSGDFDYELGHVICDFRDSAFCPQYSEPPSADDAINFSEAAEALMHMYFGSPVEAAPPSAEALAAVRTTEDEALLPIQQTFCADCGHAREEIEPVLHCDWYCKPCWKLRFAHRPFAVDPAAVIIARNKLVASLAHCDSCHCTAMKMRHDESSDLYILDCPNCLGSRSMAPELVATLT